MLYKPHKKQPRIVLGPTKPEFDVTQYPPYTFFKPTWKSAVAKKFGTFSKKRKSDVHFENPSTKASSHNINN